MKNSDILHIIDLFKERGIEMDISINYSITNVSLSTQSTIPNTNNTNIEKPVENIKKVDNYSPHQVADTNKDKSDEDKALLITMRDKATQTELTAKYYVDKDTNQYVVQFLGKDKSVVKQIPAEFMLELAKYLDKYKGLFVEDKA